MYGVSRVHGVKKLSPRYVGPYTILERVGPLAYRLELPPELENLHDVFHVLSLRKALLRSDQYIPATNGPVASDRSVRLEPVQIVDHEIRTLRRKSVPLVKVLWSNHGKEEFTWEPMDLMQGRYPELFAPTLFLERTSWRRGSCWRKPWRRRNTTAVKEKAMPPRRMTRSMAGNGGTAGNEIGHMIYIGWFSKLDFLLPFPEPDGCTAAGRAREKQRGGSPGASPTAVSRPRGARNPYLRPDPCSSSQDLHSKVSILRFPPCSSRSDNRFPVFLNIDGGFPSLNSVQQSVADGGGECAGRLLLAQFCPDFRKSIACGRFVERCIVGQDFVLLRFGHLEILGLTPLHSQFWAWFRFIADCAGRFLLELASAIAAVVIFSSSLLGGSFYRLIV
ncbi:hypothetical protein KSP39_PZI020181 [Platanthera zijinensis]|uniref:Tf2-1-like SH3-like domain-containing protein n=1 Tax=Platanthera zijinensis TaxID=2320716 RepID=A0AAP0AZE4_9ASPA